MKILITAGSTWVRVDDVRILTNCFTGKTGLYLARELKKKGHSITLLVNPHCIGEAQDVKAAYYHYFDEFKIMINKLLKNNHFDMIIHTAAVSDYKLKKHFKGKVSSGKKELNLELIPAEKIIKQIRKLARRSVLIQFKLEAKRKGLCEKAYESLRENKSDYVVANALEDLRRYKAFIIDKDKNITIINSKKNLARGIINRINLI
ncbi:MAG: phosphopantothenoylcysteine decarboxylase [Candidatus Omnitrophota bacterium]